ATPRARRDIGLKRRYAAEARFRLYGILAIALGIFFLLALLFTVFKGGYTAFWQTSINLPITFSAEIIDPDNKRATDPTKLASANYPLLARNALAKALDIDAGSANRADLKLLSGMVSLAVRTQLHDIVVAAPSVIGTSRNVWVLAAADVDSAHKGQIDLAVPEARRKVKDRQVEWMNAL